MEVGSLHVYCCARLPCWVNREVSLEVMFQSKVASSLLPKASVWTRVPQGKQWVTSCSVPPTRSKPRAPRNPTDVHCRSTEESN
eukprot:5493883-Alexandrium_andersonii.AAC.1